MQRSTLTRQRLLVVFFTGVLLLYSPLITLFEGSAHWLGVPVLYLYLFGVWVLLIALQTWIVGVRSE